MVPLFEKREPRRLTVLRLLPQSSDALGDRVAHWLLTIAWSKFLAVIAGFYVLAATLFAEGLRLTGGFGASTSLSFLDAFFMSLQALTVFGCGRLMPLTPPAKGLAIGAIFVGWLALLLMLAMTMVRFIRLRPFWRPDRWTALQDPGEKEAPPGRGQASTS